MIVNPTLERLREITARFARVSIVGLGNEGNSMVSHIFEDGGSGAQCIAVNTDKERLEHVYSHEKVLIEHNTASVDSDETKEQVIGECAGLLTPLLAGADVVFIIAKMEEKTGPSTAPIVAEVARQAGAVTVGMAIMHPPSQIGGGFARHELAGMRQACHTLAIVDPVRSMQLASFPPGLYDDSSDNLVIDMVSGLAETLACPSVVNIDVAAFRELTIHGGIAHFGVAHSSSALRVEEATIGALRGPLLYDSIVRNRGALVNVRGGSDLTIEEAQRAADLVAERAGWNMPVVVGAHVEELWLEGCQVSILLTGGVYPYIPGGYRRLPLDMYEMEPDGEEERQIDLDLDLDQLE